MRRIAEQQGMRRATLYQLICRGQLGRTRIGQAGRISQAELDRLMGHNPTS
jgi:excisionase family DNA binding protein